MVIEKWAYKLKHMYNVYLMLKMYQNIKFKSENDKG